MKLTPKLFDYISDYKYEITSFDFKKIILGVCSAKTSFCLLSPSHTFAHQFSLRECVQGKDPNISNCPSLAFT